MNEQEKKHFNVFQPEGGTVNILGDVNRKFEFIGTIEGDSMEDVYRKCQNDFSDEYDRLHRRSLCIGDLIQDNGTDIFHMVEGVGFRRLTDTEVVTVIINLLTGEERPTPNMIETITLKKKDLVVEAISKNGNVIVSMSSNKFLISRVNFNKLISSEITGVLTNVEGYDLQMFKTLKF